MKDGLRCLPQWRGLDRLFCDRKNLLTRAGLQWPAGVMGAPATRRGPRHAPLQPNCRGLFSYFGAQPLALSVR